MESESGNHDSNINIVNPSRQELLTQKAFVEEIFRNTKELETFFNLNQKLKVTMNEVVHTFLHNNEESKIISLMK
jgi:hypothetical protein